MDSKNKSKFEEIHKQIELNKSLEAPKPVIKYDKCRFGEYNIRYSKKLTKKLTSEPKKHLRKPEINKLENIFSHIMFY